VSIYRQYPVYARSRCSVLLDFSGSHSLYEDGRGIFNVPGTIRRVRVILVVFGSR